MSAETGGRYGTLLVDWPPGSPIGKRLIGASRALAGAWIVLTIAGLSNGTLGGFVLDSLAIDPTASGPVALAYDLFVMTILFGWLLTAWGVVLGLMFAALAGSWPPAFILHEDGEEESVKVWDAVWWTVFGEKLGGVP